MGSPFLKLFGRSPFGPLFEHMETAYQCSKQLIPFFTAAEADDWTQAQQIQQSINELEHKADIYKRDLRLSLPKEMFMPIARADILELISMQDHIANIAEDIAGLFLGRRMHLPLQLTTQYNQFLTRCVDAAKQAFKAIRELKDLYDSGFSGKEAAIINEMVAKLHEIEHDTDEMQIGLRQALFKIEQDLPPIHAMFLYKIITITAQLADYAQKIGDRLQICIAR